MSTISFSPAYVSRHQVRLTRRGRLVVLAFAILAVLALGVMVASASAAGNHAGTPDVHVVTVHPGDTLWDIAGQAAAASGTQTGQMVQRLEDLNTLNDGMVYVGQQIRVPNS
jgi:Tfp pilus assembly protein FimV